MLRIKFNFSLCMMIEVVLVLCIVIGTIMQIGSLISLCFALSFIVLLAYLVKRALTTKFDVIPLLLIFTTVICVVVNGWLSPEAQWGFDYFKKMLMFIAFCLLFYFAVEDDVDLKCSRSIRRLPILMAVLLVASYYLGFNRVMLGRYLTLGFANPNFTGMWLLHFFVLASLGLIDKRENTLVRIVSALLLPMIVYLITMTKSRSCLMALVAYVVFCLLAYFVKRGCRMKLISAIVLVFPVLVVLVYQYLLRSAWFVAVFDIFASEGKGLDARSGIWLQAAEAIENSPLWGDYAGISEGTGMSQMHNIYLDIFASYGLVVGALFFVLLLGGVIRMVHYSDSYYQYCAVSGFFAIIVAGTFEAAMVSGAMGLNVLTALLVVFAKRNRSDSMENSHMKVRRGRALFR